MDVAHSNSERATAEAIEELRRHLNALAPGKVENRRSLAKLLAACWNRIENSGLYGMGERKLSRIERVEWAPPVLSFVIERHGATVLGSTRGALHRWTVNLDTLIADCDSHYSYRQLSDRDTPLRIRPLVEEIARLIVGGSDDRRLRWDADRLHVRILVTEFIGGRFGQTVAGRRKRFRRWLDTTLEPQGWYRVPHKLDVYARASKEQ